MCLVWCHGNPIGKWDRTHLVVPTRPVAPEFAGPSASGSSFDSVDDRPCAGSVAARRSFLV